MTEALSRPANVARVNKRRGIRAASLGARAWTGRSAIRAATTTPRPPLATTETGKTRVSEMRLSARIIGRPVMGAPVGPESTAFARRDAGDPPLTSG